MAEVDVSSMIGTRAGVGRPGPRAPALESGDRLTRCEFERRYMARPDIRKAELIEGVVHMPSPVRLAGHAKPHSAIQGMLFTYAAFTPGVSVADNATVRLDLDNEPQPDVSLWIDEEAGGQSRVSDSDARRAGRGDSLAPWHCVPLVPRRGGSLRQGDIEALPQLGLRADRHGRGHGRPRGYASMHALTRRIAGRLPG